MCSPILFQNDVKCKPDERYVSHKSWVSTLKLQHILVALTWLEHNIRPWIAFTMTMSSPVETEGITLAQPIPIPTLTVLPPSSDTESWSRSPSPRLSRFIRHGRSHRSRTRAKKRNEEDQGCTLKQDNTPRIVIEETAEKSTFQHRSPSPSPSVATLMESKEQGQGSPSQDLLLPPSRSWSRSPSPSRRSRWSLRSLLSRDSDWDSSRLVCWSHHK